MKWLSVIVPCYNVEKYIDRCVDSLVNQTIGIDNMELIFVNDASTDTTYDRLCQWEAKYSDSILVINCDKNGKQGTARNIGITYASAEYIGFVDSDDWIELSMYEKMYDKAITTGADVVGVLAKRVDETGKVLYIENVYQGELDTFCNAENGYFRGLAGGIWSGLYRKQLILENQIWFPEGLVYEDNYWGGVLNYYIKEWYIIGEPLYNYLLNSDSTSMKQGASHHYDRLQIEKKKLSELKKRGFYEKDKDYIEFNFFNLYYLNTIHIVFFKEDTIPYDLLRQIQKDVCELFPNIENNPDCLKLSSWPKFFLDIIRTDVSNERWEFIKRAYLMYFNNLEI